MADKQQEQMQEIISGKRSFEVTKEDDTVLKLSVRMPTAEEQQAGDWEYSKAFNRAIVNGILPASRLQEILTENGVWTTAKDEAIEAKAEEVRDLTIKLEEAKAKKEKEELAEKLGQERSNLLNMRQELNDLLAHSAENKADEAQRNFLVALVVETEDGKPYWGSIDKFNKETDGNIIFRAVYEYMTFINDVPSDFAASLPENQVQEEEIEVEPAKEEDKKEEKSKKEEDKKEEDEPPY